jgi:hypothetical protein
MHPPIEMRNRIRLASLAVGGGLLAVGSATSTIDARAAVLLAVVVLGWTQLPGL